MVTAEEAYKPLWTRTGMNQSDCPQHTYLFTAYTNTGTQSTDNTGQRSKTQEEKWCRETQSPKAGFI